MREWKMQEHGRMEISHGIKLQDTSSSAS